MTGPSIQYNANVVFEFTIFNAVAINYDDYLVEGQRLGSPPSLLPGPDVLGGPGAAPGAIKDVGVVHQDSDSTQE